MPTNAQDIRPWQMHLIPVAELRKCIASILTQEISDDELANRLLDHLGISTLAPRGAIGRLTRQQANKLIWVCPEITPEALETLYTEYRYGMNPSLRVFLFDRNLPDTLQLDAAHLTETLSNYLEHLDTETESWPTVRRVRLTDKIVQLVGKPALLEGTYRFSQLLEYISEEQDAEATYETKYGYFWVNRYLGYVAVHGSNEKVVKAIRQAFEDVTDIGLVGLLISQQFRNRLSFLIRETITATSVTNPDQSSGLPHSATFRDPHLHSKGLDAIEAQYSGKKEETYRTDVDENTNSPLVVKQNGTFRLKGKVPSASFRDWSLRSLEEVMQVWDEFGDSATSCLIATDVDSTPEFKRLRSRKKKQLFGELVDALYLAKCSIGDISPRLSVTPLELAQVFKDDIKICIPYSCANMACEESGHHMCDCGSRFFRVRSGSEWRVQCANPDHKSRAGKLPLIGMCEQWHPYSLDRVDIEDTVEVRFGSGLKELIQEFVNRRVPRFSIDFRREDFYITGHTFVYQASEDDNSRDTGNTYIKNQTIIKRDQNIVSGASNVENIDQGGGEDDSA